MVYVSNLLTWLLRLSVTQSLAGILSCLFLGQHRKLYAPDLSVYAGTGEKNNKPASWCTAHEVSWGLKVILLITVTTGPKVQFSSIRWLCKDGDFALLKFTRFIPLMVLLLCTEDDTSEYFFVTNSRINRLLTDIQIACINVTVSADPHVRMHPVDRTGGVHMRRLPVEWQASVVTESKDQTDHNHWRWIHDKSRHTTHCTLFPVLGYSTVWAAKTGLPASHTTWLVQVTADVCRRSECWSRT